MTTTTDPAPAPNLPDFAAANQTYNPPAPPQPVLVYETIVWLMASGSHITITDGSATYPQVGVEQFKNESSDESKALNVHVPSTCGASYQIDVYVQKFGTYPHITDNTSDLNTLYTNGLAGPNGAQDGSYLAGAGSNPGVSGLGSAWRYVTNNPCPPPPPVCIPDSAVSYTYSHNDANTGVITVGPNPNPNSTGILCHPFWVTATSWKFTTTTSDWPQTVDVVDQLAEISVPGQYTYTAAVTCGQGDIYASTDSSAPSLNPAHYPVDTGELLGSNNPFPEHFLSDMGFTQTGSSGPTYVVDNDNCFTPPTPTKSYGSCQVPNGNSLDLPAVPGGEWTISWTGNHHTTYSDNTAVSITDATLPDGYVTYTITLADDNSHDSFHVTSYTGSWKPVDVRRLGCETGTPTSSLAKCEAPNGNSLDLPAVPGGKWTVSWSTGHVTYGNNTETSLTGANLPHGYVTYTITLADDNSHDSFTVVPPLPSSWTPVDATTLHCVVQVTSGTVCSFVNGVSFTDLTLTFDNTGSTTVTFVVNGVSYPVTAGQTGYTADIGLVTPGSSFDVTILGSPNVFATVTAAVPNGFGCQPTTITGDPTAAPGTCNSDSHTPNNNGSITVELSTGLSYEITGPGGYDMTRTGTTGTATLTGLAPGNYSVTATALPGYTISPVPSGPNWTQSGSSWVFSIPVPTVICDLGASAVQPTCSTATNPVQIQGSITVALDDNVVYTVENTSANPTFNVTLNPSGTTSVPNGTYEVTVALSATGIANHFALPSTPPSWNFVIDGSNLLCLPVLAAWNAGATSTNTTCSSSHLGTITLSHPAGQANEVDYVVTNDATSAVVYSGTAASDTVLHVAAGHYTATASPVNPLDGISGNAGPYQVIVAATTVICGGDLALTGGTIGWFGFALAGGMLFLGIAFLYMKRRGNRTAE